MKLISMTDYALKIERDILEAKRNRKKTLSVFYLEDIINYAHFLKQPLKLGIFVPCDEYGNVLEEPTDMYSNPQYYGSEMDEYQEAKEKVLFKDKINMPKNNDDFLILTSLDKYNIVEDLIPFDLELINKIKELGL